MKFVNILKKLDLIDVEKLIKEVKELFKMFKLSNNEENIILDNAAKILLRKQSITYSIAKSTFNLQYIKTIKQKIKDETINIEEIIFQYPEIKDNILYKDIINAHQRKLNSKTTPILVFDLPFITINPNIPKDETIKLLNSCSEIQYNYVLNHLTKKEHNILIKKYGIKLDENNVIGVKDNQYLIDVIIPKIDNMINRFAGYYYFDQIFADKNNKLESVSAFYSLDSRYKRILIRCYGPKLDQPIDKNISQDLEQKLKNLIIPRLRNNDNKITNSRKMVSFQRLLISGEDYTLSMLPQGYIDLINAAIGNDQKVFSSCSNSSDTKELIRIIDYLLEIILTSEEISILSYHYGLIDNQRLTFKEIADKFGLKKSKISNNYISIIEKLRLSPELKKLFQYLNKKNNSIQLNALIKKTSEDNKGEYNLLTSFYGFFSKDEVTKLSSAMRCLTADEILLINDIFYLGLSQEINLKNIYDEEKIQLKSIVEKIKQHILNDNHIENSFSGQKIYNICTRLYVEPIYNDICSNLSTIEKDVLNLCLTHDDLGEETLKYISTILNKPVPEIISVLKMALQKISIILHDKSKNNVLIRQLMISQK
ncbi:MAG: hypothetical protein IJO33_01905 [Bacilli bacterium]|nr:hypothetical protein [Bacilli bacterium]